MKGKETILLVAAGLLSLTEPMWAGDIAEPGGYRMDEYRAPVPQTLQGASVVTTAEAEALWREKKAVFFDVMPNTPKPANLPAGTIWREAIRKDIPGSIWLANVGYGAISEETASYFRQGLAAEAGADKSRALLFYCMTNCWMSWNAAKRAVEWGYSSVIWYPLGADGWERANLPLEEKKPYVISN
ncbi:PQQ-dependent catabolism-associated CXXCW motif protein [Mesorhizobium sp. M6A.T.Ce.TU.016.01.1.1]|uniref:PQQ-dependent catabolism-associated CXXCW motif protein n=1 Tax=Mesorhizobium sp. M6A.T.Ce.TU.016.01.1.1 TaxID=2496783 RepID=UPI000FC9E470|nr:PQQ-dependent catabolism-associated CXXCW motif protein [Mesorhizobium sp. M6A.T.Ce.TU.016.01.1.1]RUU28662.1 PQQ-dependent catabolism-associated CXXCW motif protein [Mesorhizobium sp. M6A.T.Ce.TU.016.01.1.1]